MGVTALQPRLATAGTAVATRDAFGQALAEWGERLPDLVVLDADVTNSTKTEVFGRRFPERFFNLGLCEAHMISAAAGLAACGKVVVASTFAIFASQRALNQIFQSVAYNRLNVKIAVSHAGLTVGEDGASHQVLDDVAAMRAMPGMAVVVPADGEGTRAALAAALEYEGPVYLRLGRPAVPPVYEHCPFALGRALVLRPGRDVTLVGIGIMVGACLKAADLLAREGIQAEVIDAASVKPLDRETLLASAAKTGAVVTAEEHTVLGGLGGAVAEAVAEEHPVPVLRVGVEDAFGQSGTWQELLASYGLTAEAVAAKARAAVARARCGRIGGGAGR